MFQYRQAFASGMLFASDIVSMKRESQYVSLNYPTELKITLVSTVEYGMHRSNSALLLY